MTAIPQGPLALDRLLALYLAASGVLAALSLDAAGLAAGGVHLAVALGLSRWTRRPLPVSAAGRFLRAVYPVALTPLLYAELSFLNQLFAEGYLDPIVQGWEASLFGGQPSVEVARRFPSFWLSELLHAGYFAYYLIVPAALLGIYRTRRARALHAVAFQTALAFFLCYLVFILFPVAGPRYLFTPIAGARAEGTLFALVHAVLESGSSKGTAFPSSHIAAAWAAVLACWRIDVRWFWLLVAPAAALAAGTIYGRFHYGVDAVAGIALAFAVHATAPALLRRLGEWPPRQEAAGRPGNPDRGSGIQSLESPGSDAWRNGSS